MRTSTQTTTVSDAQYDIGSLDELTDVIGGAPTSTILGKVIDHLDGHCRDFIACSPFIVLSTVGADGRCDASPRGGPAGWVEVVDEKHLVFPDAPGNRLIDTLRAICETGRLGMLFVIPGFNETLRVNGRAWLTRDPEVLDRHEIQKGRPPKLAVVVEVEEAYLHCAKAFIRSDLWKSDAWPSTERLARPSQIWKDHIALPEVTLEAVDELVEDEYTNNLY